MYSTSNKTKRTKPTLPKATLSLFGMRRSTTSTLPISLLVIICQALPEICVLKNTEPLGKVVQPLGVK